MSLRFDLLGRAHAEPATKRIIVAVYPDGHECRIEPDRVVGSSHWRYDRGASAGLGKADAVASAEDQGVRIETRVVPNPNDRAG